MGSRIAVIGLGYVGLPLALALARHYPVTGFDIKQSRIKELKSGHDRTGESSVSDLRSSTIELTSSASKLKNHDVYIVTVPTPVTAKNKPDLTPLRLASETVGKVINKGAVIVFESTVYPGVTEDFCGGILAKTSGLKCGRDFFLGYSPERINPGDREHTLERITKVVSGQTPEVEKLLREIYGSINGGNVFMARNIKTAEAAKVIENAQRDINIAFINEITTIMNRIDVSIYDVLAAAGTKWNFLKFQPGLVGGHCIGVDPYYLAEFARDNGCEPQVILSGRRINESMGGMIAGAISKQLNKKKAKILVLGLTFKENVPDLRNTKVIDLVSSLKTSGHIVDVHDPLADPAEAKHEYNLKLLPKLGGKNVYDCVVAAVPHREYCRMTARTLTQMMKPDGLIADVKHIWPELKLPKGLRYWSL